MKERPGVLKSCLFGCLGLFGLFVLFLVIMAVLAGISMKDKRPMDTVLAPEALAPKAVIADAELSTIHPGRLILDVSQGELIIKPARPGEQLNVRVKYDAEVHEVVENYEVAPDSSWVYELRFHRTMPGMQALFRQIMAGGGDASVVVRIPADLPVGLEIRLRQGGFEAELGGLWLTHADIDYSQGGFALEFDEPVREPMDHLVIHGSMGGFGAAGLGNASPRSLVVDCRMGGADIGLDGAWLQDCDIRLKVRMGGMDVRVPDNVVVQGVETLPDDLELAPGEVPLPVLRFSIDQEMGEIDVR
ncbi:hypothetical protein DRQ50_03255 [bacterium]|nr:MAG: hypothetical protein DRQ50_03255 [bacterium]